MANSKPPSIRHFEEVVHRIRANSWFSTEVLTGRAKFNFQITGDQITSSDVPAEAFDSLLLSVRKLTMDEAPEQLHKVLRKLKQSAASDRDRVLLDAWKQYWKLAFIKDPVLLQTKDGSVREILTPYRIYNGCINGHLFHSDNKEYNVFLYGGDPVSCGFELNLFVLNWFHAVVCNLAFAALGLDRYIKNGCTFDKITVLGNQEPAYICEFILLRSRVDDLKRQYQVYSDWIEGLGGCAKCRWA